jgi:hypothetical protein
VVGGYLGVMQKGGWVSLLNPAGAPRAPAEIVQHLNHCDDRVANLPCLERLLWSVPLLKLLGSRCPGMHAAWCQLSPSPGQCVLWYFVVNVPRPSVLTQAQAGPCRKSPDW